MAVDEKLLKENPFFEGMDEWYIEQLSRYADPLEIKEGEYVFRQGGKADRFYLILEGEVQLEFQMDNKTIPVQILPKGELLGWSWLVEPYTWRFSAKAIKPLKLISLHGKYLRAKCEEDHHLGYEVMKRLFPVILKRLQLTRKKLVEKSSS